jgi:hypothetical protein
MLSNFKVWDEFNASEDTAWEIAADDAEEAAVLYAEKDVDGNTDGIYTCQGREMHNLTAQGQPVSVRCPDGTLKRFKVGIVEFEPVYKATEIANHEREKI